MFDGPPLPLSPGVHLKRLLEYARPGQPLGAWVRPCRSLLQIYPVPNNTRCVVLASADLGMLLRRCAKIALREGARTRVLPAESLIHWRTLQVATATPHLPALTRLRPYFPRMCASAEALLIPIDFQTPEQVLGRCLAEGVRVTSSRVVYSWNRDTPRRPVDATAPGDLG